MSSIPNRTRSARARGVDLTALIPDFPYDYGAFLAERGPTPLFDVPESAYGSKVLVVGAGVSGLVTAYELLRCGLHPVLVDASGRAGGRLNDQHIDQVGKRHHAELGGMRFPVSAKSLWHYLNKWPHARDSAPFPNPGTEAAVSTVVDYRGDQFYYEYESEEFPIPPQFEQLEDYFFGEFLEQDPLRFSDMEAAMNSGQQSIIKEIWNNLVAPAEGESWDNSSFYESLVRHGTWTADDIQLFGQVGFGTGGWNTDFPNSFLEVLRVLYTGLDVDHRLLRNGTGMLVSYLYDSAPASAGDEVRYWAQDTTVRGLSDQEFPGTNLHQEVTHIKRGDDGRFTVRFRNSESDAVEERPYEAVVYTPHVRILDKLRYTGDETDYQSATELFDASTWEAIMYTHYMQSSKVYAAIDRPFWNEDLPAPGEERALSVTLSDRITRGTYLLDYTGGSINGGEGAGIFLSYTWNDDSLKYLGDGQGADAAEKHAHICLNMLRDIYPNVDFDKHLVHDIDTGEPFISWTWEQKTHYLGAFKMNLPGQYRYQRRLFSQFMDGVDEGTPDGIVLAGDDVSWVAGWAESAVTTAVNAINKIALVFNPSESWPTDGPISAWNELQPAEQVGETE